MSTTNTLDKIFERPLLPVSEREVGLLIEAERGVKSLGDRFNIAKRGFSPPRTQPILAKYFICFEY